jgi:phenylacetic acid degradation protein paaN
MSSPTPPSDLVARHAALLESGLQAFRTRESFSAFEGRRPSGPTREEADQQFDALLGSELDLDGHPGEWTPQPDEISPYTGEPLAISYPRCDVSTLVAASTATQETWATTPYAERVALCLEMIERLFEANELLAIAAVHTTGQGRGMSQSGSGTNALDRGLEAACAAYAALDRVPTSGTWTRSFGTTSVSLDKTFSTIPLGPAVVVACASFPAWNVYPAVFANLATGNPVIVKPHPSSVLQMALAIQIMRSTLTAAGHDPDLVLLATDTVAEQITTGLLTHDGVRIVDFTGSAIFGTWVEQNVRQAAVYTETSGVNSVVVESLGDVDAMIRSLAGTLVLFSGQMCVAPQNIYVPAAGITTPDGTLSTAEFGDRLVAAIGEIIGHPKRAAALMGTVQSARTVTAMHDLADVVRGRGRVLLEPAGFEHPEHPRARTCGPLVAELSIEDHDLYGREQFGPVAFLIPVADADAGLAQATTDARNEGAISAFVLSQDEDFIARAERAYALAGAALSINITGPMPMGFSAAFSDYHVSGLNPAGTATLTDEAFIAGRFRVVQSRRPAAIPAAPAASEKRN